jgi:Family of unknown function (DUF6113)
VAEPAATPADGVSTAAGDRRRPTRVASVGTALVTLLAGGLAGLVGSFAQAWAPGSVPVGLGVGLAALGGALVVGVLAGGAPGAGAVTAGWGVAVVGLLWPRREGDVVLAATTTAYAYLFCGVLLCALGIAAGHRRRGRPGPSPADPPAGLA